MASRTSTSLAGKMRNLATSHQPAIDVQLDGPAQPVRTFSTLDTIQGRVVISAAVDTRFDRLEIALVGHTRSYVDKATTIAAANGRNEAFQQFLCLQQPIDAYPSPRAIDPAAPLTLPFTFVVPQHLLPRACSHKCNNTKLKQCHLALPPSLGDAELAGYGSTLLDDLSPSMAQIAYGVRVRVFRNRQRDGKEIILAAHTAKIRVVPGVEEQPPVTFDARDDEYCVRKERSIRKGLLKARTGRIAIEAAQPTSFRLPSPRACQGPPDVATMATLHLRFDPVEAAAQPPKLNSLASKLKAVTFFASTPRRDFPNKAAAVYDSSQGLVFESLPLAHRCMSSVTWEKHDGSATGARRDSVMSLSGIQASAGHIAAPTKIAAPGMPFYTARLLVPLDLPKNKAIVPTFHSCLVSRVYILELNLSISNAPGTSTLKLPVQVSCDSGNDAVISRRASEAASSTQSSDDGFMGLRNSFEADALEVDAPPEYSDVPASSQPLRR